MLFVAFRFIVTQPETTRNQVLEKSKTDHAQKPVQPSQVIKLHVRTLQPQDYRSSSSAGTSAPTVAGLIFDHSPQ
jgi:hypothetical protein